MGRESSNAETDFDSRYNITGGNHLYQFYKGREDFFRIMIPFFQAGLEKGDGCLWLVSQKMGLEEAKTVAEKEIPRFETYCRSGQFQILSAENWYLVHGFFNEAKALSNAKRFMREMAEKGYHRLRISGDAGAIPHEDWSDNVGMYEEKVNTIVKSGPNIVLCAYPILECDLKDTKMVLDLHDDVLVGKL